MFKIAQTETFTWPVTVKIPADGGRYESHTFDAKFKRISQSRIDELNERLSAGTMSDREFVNEILDGWSGVIDESNQQVPYSDSTRDALLQVTLVRTAIIAAYSEAYAGAQRKN